MKPGVTPFAVIPLAVNDDADPATVEVLSVDHESDLVALIELSPFVAGVVPEIEWAIVGPSSVDEGDTATYTITADGDLTGQTATITVATASGPGSGTAASGTDYTALSTVLTFTGGGATSKTVAVSTIEDTLFEGTEDFLVTLAGPSTGEIVNANAATALVDDEAITFGLAGSTQVNEGSSGTYTVSYTGATLGPGITAAVTLATTTGAQTWPNATAGVDFTGLSTVLTFTGGGATSKTAGVSTIQDTIVEGTEDFTVTLAGPTKGTLGTSQTNTIVVDDDASNLTWNIAGATQITEGDTGTYTVNYTGVTLAPGVTATITVATATGGNTNFTDATSGTDFTALSTVLTFTGGAATQKTVAVSTIEDTSSEGTEDFRVTLGSGSIGSLGTSQAVTLIADDDGGGGFTCDAATFDGTNDYLTRGADWSSISDSKVLLASFWIKGTAFGASARLWCDSSGRTEINIRDNSPTSLTIEVKLRNSGNTDIGTQQFDATGLDDGNYHHIYIYVDLAVTSIKVYMDRSALSVSVNTTPPSNNTIDWTFGNHAIAANTAGANKLTADLAEVYFNIAATLDPATGANLDKFVTAGLKPVSLGSDGSTPTGSAPVLYLHLDDGETPADNFAANAGSGGGMTVNGALAIAATSPSD